MNTPDSNTPPCPIFVDMSLEERQRVLALLERETYQADDVILTEGHTTRSLWIIIHGSCDVVIQRNGDAEKHLAVLEPGAVFGEMSFFHPAPHSATVRATTDVEVLRLSRENFESLREADANAACKIVVSTTGILAERLRRMDAWIRDLIEQPEVAVHKQEWQEFRAALYSDWQF